MKARTLMAAAALCGAVVASPSFAKMTFTDDEMDRVTAGQFFQLAGYKSGDFVTTVPDIADTRYIDTFDVMKPYFAPGTPTLYFGPLTGSLFSSSVGQSLAYGAGHSGGCEPQRTYDLRGVCHIISLHLDN